MVVQFIEPLLFGPICSQYHHPYRFCFHLFHNVVHFVKRRISTNPHFAFIVQCFPRVMECTPLPRAEQGPLCIHPFVHSSLWRTSRSGPVLATHVHAHLGPTGSQQSKGIGISHPSDLCHGTFTYVNSWSRQKGLGSTSEDGVPRDSASQVPGPHHFLNGCAGTFEAGTEAEKSQARTRLWS